MWLDIPPQSLQASSSDGVALTASCRGRQRAWAALSCTLTPVAVQPHPAYQEGTEHVETDEVKDGKAAATGRFPFRAVAGLRLRGTLLPWHAGQHDVLPCLPCGTPRGEQ